MKKFFIIGTALIGWSLPAHAQVATFNAANALAEAKAFVQQLKDYEHQMFLYEQDLRHAEHEKGPFK